MCCAVSSPAHRGAEATERKGIVVFFGVVGRHLLVIMSVVVHQNLLSRRLVVIRLLEETWGSVVSMVDFGRAGQSVAAAHQLLEVIARRSVSRPASQVVKMNDQSHNLLLVLTMAPLVIRMIG